MLYKIKSEQIPNEVLAGLMHELLQSEFTVVGSEAVETYNDIKPFEIMTKLRYVSEHTGAKFSILGVNPDENYRIEFSCAIDGNYVRHKFH